MVSSDSTEEINATRIHQEIDRIVNALAKRHEHADSLVVVGIANGGIQLAQRIAEQLSRALLSDIQCGIVDVTFHRDDISFRPITKISIPTELEFPIDGATVILVDDVLHSGRTVRAAINELFDQGRPEIIELVALVERNGHKLPLRADYRGEFNPSGPNASVSVQLDNANPHHDHIQFVSKRL